jgi:hypothetical protein
MMNTLCKSICNSVSQGITGVFLIVALYAATPNMVYFHLNNGTSSASTQAIAEQAIKHEQLRWV